MESFVLMLVCSLALYYLSKKQDQMASSMFGEEYGRFERIYDHVSYSCYESTVVRKQMTSAIPVPVIPSLSYSAKALCLTADGHWFWFDAGIRYMKIHRSSITPTTDEEALNALKDDPEILQRYFPNSNHQSA